jgi:hypothetical protein
MERATVSIGSADTFRSLFNRAAFQGAPHENVTEWNNNKSHVSRILPLLPSSVPTYLGIRAQKIKYMIPEVLGAYVAPQGINRAKLSRCNYKTNNSVWRGYCTACSVQLRPLCHGVLGLCSVSARSST